MLAISPTSVFCPDERVQIVVKVHFLPLPPLKTPVQLPGFLIGHVRAARRSVDVAMFCGIPLDQYNALDDRLTADA
ncbi:hypothetical protein KC367_g259 [Hortaea werneckii]|nr:hypothetical protein KC367_g259 [Hortaea werneckii]